MILLPESIFLGEWIGRCRSHILYICHWGLMAWSVDQGQTNPTTGEPRPANLELPTFKHINHTYSLQSEHTRSVFTKESITFSFCKEDKHQLYKRPNEKFFLIFPLKHKIGVHYVCNLNNMLPSWSLPCQEYEHYIPSIKAQGSGRSFSARAQFINCSFPIFNGNH